MRAMSKVIDKAVNQRKVIDDFAIEISCRDVRFDSQSRGRRIAAKHRMRPIHAGIDHGDFHALSLVRVWRAGRILVEVGGYFRDAPVNLRRAYVVNAFLELKLAS